jgi:hypothetical protein
MENEANKSYAINIRVASFQLWANTKALSDRTAKLIPG